MEFPNGFTSWQETHFEIVGMITREIEQGENVFSYISENQGTGALYEVAFVLTMNFEKRFEGVEFDGDYFDKLENFMSDYIASNQ